MEFVDENNSEETDIGKYLKSYRTENKISIEELSAITKIRIENIVAIEESQKSIHIPQTYYRGYIKSYCKFFGINAEDILVHIQSDPYKPPRNSHSAYKIKSQTLKPFKQNKYIMQKKITITLTLLIVLGLGAAFLINTDGLIKENGSFGNNQTKKTQERNKSDLDSIIEIQ